MKRKRFSVEQIMVDIENGQITQYRVTLKVTFILKDTM